MMKKKLTVLRQSIAVLARESLVEVVGGDSPPCPGRTTDTTNRKKPDPRVPAAD